MAISRRATGVALLLVLGMGIAALGVFGGRLFSPQPAAVQVGVLFPGTDEDDWLQFVHGVELAARELGLPAEHRLADYECLVQLHQAPVLFRWYPEVGTGGLRRRVRQLCQSHRPPLALIGTNHSSLTSAVAHELACVEDKSLAPVLLIGYATADEIVNTYPERSFRFGFNNSHQARTVVQRLRGLYDERRLVETQVKPLIVQVRDDPFSMDLANRFACELRQAFGAEPIGPAEAMANDGQGHPDAWSLETSTGSYGSANEEEKNLARKIVDKLIAEPDSEWALVLPFGIAQFRRFSSAMHEALLSEDLSKTRTLRDHVVMLSGDSMSYYEFREAQSNGLAPAETLGPVLFFSHVNPIAPGKSGAPDRYTPIQRFYRDMVLAVLSSLPELGEEPQPAQLVQALARYHQADSKTPFFNEHHERRQGGGAVVAVPRPKEGRFELLLPRAWQQQ